MIARKVQEGVYAFGLTPAEAAKVIAELSAQLADVGGAGSTEFVVHDADEDGRLKARFCFMVQNPSVCV